MKRSTFGLLRTLAAAKRITEVRKFQQIHGGQKTVTAQQLLDRQQSAQLQQNVAAESQPKIQHNVAADPVPKLQQVVPTDELPQLQQMSATEQLLKGHQLATEQLPKEQKQQTDGKQEQPQTAEEISETIDLYASYTPNTLTLDHFVKFRRNLTTGSQSRSFRFLREELVVRLANILKEFELLPDQLYQRSSVQTVQNWYVQSFRDILYYKDLDADNSRILQRFNETLSSILDRHDSVVETMAEGVLEMKEEDEERHSLEYRDVQNVQYFLDRFYLSRIGIRMLICQHMLLFNENQRKDSRFCAIDERCDVLKIAKIAYHNARYLCERTHLTAPECNFQYKSPYEQEKDRILMTYVPAHLYYMLFELLKNSLRAVVEHNEGNDELPNIDVLICKSDAEVTIKISDQGGGIPKSKLDDLYSYTYSTAPRPISGCEEASPMAGLGYGLPLSHLYARYLSGDLWLNPVEGYGTDAMICLKLSPSENSEVLPLYNKTSVHKYMHDLHIPDWTDSHCSLEGKVRTAVGNGDQPVV